MNKLLTAVIAASALTAAVPALAQTSFDDRAASMDRRIDAGIRSGELNSGEASVLRSRLREIQRMQDRYQLDGMRGWEARELDRRYDKLSDQLYSMRHTEYRYHRWADDLW